MDDEKIGVTSSAATCSVSGTLRPRAFAVFRLMTSSYLVGTCTGRSAGFSPLRMRSTYSALAGPNLADNAATLCSISLLSRTSDGVSLCAVALAKWTRGEADRFDPAGLP